VNFKETVKDIIYIISGLLLILIAVESIGAEDFPKSAWKDQPDPIADASAMPGGEVSIFGGQYPKSLNYYLDSNVLSAEIFGWLFETLLTMNPITLEYEPGLAEKWSISDDKKSFTFTINSKACWSDGTPVTAADVRWTYDVIMNPNNLTGPHKANLEKFEPPQVIDDRTIKFIAKEIHWKNLMTVGEISILCKHAYEKQDFNKINFEFPVVSGPYQLGKLDEGVSISLARRDKWWDRTSFRSQHKGNFEAITYKFFAERTNAYEAFKKGGIDIYPVYTSRIWIDETNGDAFLKNQIIKQKIYNHKPVGFQGFAMNMRKPPFDDINVRQAMALLLDRQKMNQTLMYSQYFLHRSYFEDLYSDANPCPNPLIAMDKSKARELLKKAGWKVNPQTGFLEKKGQKFTFRFLLNDSTTEKFLAIYAEDLKDAGIEMVIDYKDWASWARDIDEYNYQMTWAAWSSGVFKDPETMWSSKEADRKGGNNITGFKNEQVDELMENQKSIFDINARNEIFRRMDQIIYQAYPYVLLWNIDYTRLLYWNKFGTPPTVLSKYSDESSALVYWWIDPDAQAALNDAIKMKMPLAPRPASVKFDAAYIK